MRVAIDDGRCQGSARCCALLPALLDTDDYGYGVVLDGDVVPSDSVSDVQFATRTCPEGAIQVVGEI